MEVISPCLFSYVNVINRFNYKLNFGQTISFGLFCHAFTQHTLGLLVD
jgi:hypothetical protein